MNKSQLRRLALDYSLGKMLRPEYVRRRRSLLDGITDGDIPIEREAPPEIDEFEQTSKLNMFEPEAAGAAPAHRWLYAVVGLAVIVLVSGVSWMYLQTGPSELSERQLAINAGAQRTSPSGAGSGGTASSGTTDRIESPARLLVESFVTVRDWSAASVAEFKARWSQLSQQQREDARRAIWFKRLTKAMRDELKTQKALLEFDRTGKAQQTGMRILALADFVGATGNLPDFPLRPSTAGGAGQASGQGTSTSAGGAATTAIAGAPPAAGTDDGGAQSPTEKDAAPAGSPTPSPAPQPVRQPAAVPTPGPTWLAALDPGHFTLQLFAVNRLAKVAELRRQHPQLDLKILDLPEQSPRYRILYGAYPTQAAAIDGHKELPQTITSAQPVPYPKSIAAMQALAGSGTGSVAAGTAPMTAGATQSTPVTAASPAPATTASAGGADNQYTLQVFASSNKANVDRLVNSHPDLALEVRETVSQAARYRVVYGHFESQAKAQAAAQSLPPEIISRTGRPIVKAIADLDAMAPN